MEGLNDEMSMQLMVATFTNYQKLVDKALMFLNHGQGSPTLEASPNPELGRTCS